MEYDVVRVSRGSLWWFADDIADKHTGERGMLRGDRPILVISNVSSPNSTCTITYLPVSKMESAAKAGDWKLKEFYAVPITLPLKGGSYVVCNQLMTSPTNHLRGYIGQLHPEKMKQVEYELMRYLGLPAPVSETEEPLNKEQASSEPDEIAPTYPYTTTTDSSTSDDIVIDDIPPRTYTEPVKRNTKPVMYIVTGTTYESVAEASESLGISVSTIYKAAAKHNADPTTKFKYV